MEWDFTSLQRLIGQRIEAVGVKEICSPAERQGRDDLIDGGVRLVLNLEDGSTMEFVFDGLAYAEHLPDRVSLPDVRHHLKSEGFPPVAEAAEDRDQPGGVRMVVYDRESP